MTGRSRRRRTYLAWACLLVVGGPAAGHAESKKIRLLHVDSYHREYTQTAFGGFCDGLLKLGYLDNQDQVIELIKHDAVESSTAVIRRLWMDSKRKSTKPEMMEATVRLTKDVEAFQPTLLFLSDDGATNYIGNQFLDTEIPMVFFGVKNTPLKYGLIDSLERPGHNITGVYAVGFYKECLQLLKTIVPSVKTFAILSDAGETGRSHVKAVEEVAREGLVPLELVETVVTKQFEEWQRKALELQEKVDAFYLAAMNQLEDGQGRDIPREEALRWYLQNIRIPETTHGRTYVEQGALCSADFSRYNQGFEAVEVAHDILTKGMSPATYPPRSVKRGPLVVNRQRAQMLGLTLTPAMGIEEVIEEASLLKEQAAKAKP